MWNFKKMTSIVLASALFFTGCSNIYDPVDPDDDEITTVIYKEDFGTSAVQDGTQWPNITAYQGFNKTGAGSTSVTYSSEVGLVTLRTNSPSSGYTGASGSVNAMMATGGAALLVNDIAVCGARNLVLSFGSNQTSEVLKVAYRINGTTQWVELEYEKYTENWDLVDSVLITLPETANTIKLRFTAGTTQFGTRIDDIKITTTDTVSDPVVDPDEGGGAASGLELCGDTATPVSSLIENFDGIVNNSEISLEGWRNVQVKGDRNWLGRIFTSGTTTETYAQATAHNGAAPNYEYWLITPPLDLDAAESKTFSFKTAKAFWTPTSSLKVYLLKCENGTTTQTQITTAYIVGETDADHVFVPSGEIDLSSYSGIVYIGFQYVALGGASNSTTFRIDDVWFNNSATSIAINSSAVTSVLINETYNYNITTNVSNPVGNTTITVTGLPNWATFVDNGDGTASISGIANELGSHQIKITATNNSVVATQEYTLSVENEPVAGGNLLNNGSFEDWVDGKPVGWTMISTSVTGSIASAETTIVNEGNTSLKINATSASGTVNWAQSVSIQGGKKYQLSMSYYIVSGDGTDARIWSNFKKGETFLTEAELIQTGLYSILRGPGNSNSSGTVYFPDEKGVWKSYTTSFTAPENVDGFDFQFRTYRTAVVLWDNFSLVEID